MTQFPRLLEVMLSERDHRRLNDLALLVGSVGAGAPTRSAAVRLSINSLHEKLTRHASRVARAERKRALGKLAA